MKVTQPTLLITGATGFIGSYLVNRTKENFNIYVLSRRSPKTFNYRTNPNIRWLQADIGDKRQLSESLEKIDPEFPVDFVIHLAGFYDFNYDNNPEYERTNVNGTANVLDAVKGMNVRRFLFASSVAACDFPRKDNARICETTPADAPFAYAESKRKGEEMVKQYSREYKCTVVRFAAAFSDWCEYGPLYNFLNTWLSRNWKSHILGGRGKAAIPYIHVYCLINLLLEVMERTDELPRFDTYIASSMVSVSHNELFDLSNRFFFGESRKPFHMPKWIAYAGLVSMDMLGMITGNRPFERPWMIRYIDKQMLVDNSYTRDQLNWRPTRRYVIQRRLLYMIEHMKSFPFEWQKRNHLLLKQKHLSPNFRIHEALDQLRDQIITECVDSILDPGNYNTFKNYHSVERAILKKDTDTLYQFLSVAVRSKDRMPIINYAREIAHIRSAQNFDPQEVLDAVQLLGKIVMSVLSEQESLKGMEQEIYDEVNLTFQLVLDEIEGQYEALTRAKQPLHRWNNFNHPD